MRIATSYRTLVLMLLAWPIVSLAVDSPPPPPGFNWHVATNGVGTFLKPDGWHAFEQTKGNTNAVFITPENLQQHGQYKIGFSVNQVSDFSSSGTLKASQYAKVFIQKIIDQHQLISSGVVKDGATDMNVARVKAVDNGVETITHHIAIGLDGRDQLYLIAFQAPAAEWASYNDTAGQMFNYFILGS